MKTMMLAGALWVLGAGVAWGGAAEIKGKWGIGAGVFGGGGEVSLIRGKTERSAWIFDVGINQSYYQVAYEESGSLSTPYSGLAVRRAIALDAGPGYRRFVRPSEEFSPYWSVRLRGRYGRSTTSEGLGARSTDVGVDADLSLGLEYFTPWHFSVAAHSGVARLGWLRSTRATDYSSGGVSRRTSDVESFSVGLSPVLFVRGYF